MEQSSSKPITVEVRFAEDGTVWPHRLTWQGQNLPVTGVGRQWTDKAGRHVLVMTPGNRVFELLLDRASLCWRVVQSPNAFWTS